MPAISIDYEKCTKCQTCTRICPMGLYTFDGDKIVIGAQDECIACMGCVGACPVDVITIVE